MRRFVQAFAEEDALPRSLGDAVRRSLSMAGDHYNIGKGDDAWVILRDHDDRFPTAERFRWGLVPTWSKAPDTPYTTVTARLERASRNRIFGKPWKSQHCIVPLSGYYKWDRTSKPFVPYFIHEADGKTLFAAGLWEHWHPDEQSLHTFTILTHPNRAIPSPLTQDGPIFLGEKGWTTWFDGPNLFPAAFLKAMPQPALRAYAVSGAYRDRSRDDYTLLEPREASSYLEPSEQADEDDDEYED